MALLKLSALIAALAIFAGFLGVLHPFFDSLAIGRPLAAVWLLLTGIFLRKYYRIAALGLALFALLPIVFSMLPSKQIPDPKFTIYQHNLLFTNSAPDIKLVSQQLSPDVMTLQEISSARENILTLENYTNQVICKFAAVGDVGVLSKHPIVMHGCSDGRYRGFAWARVKNENGNEVTIVSIHTHWPYPYKQAAQVEEIIPQLKELPQPIILSGDFNHVAWSHALRSLTNAVDGANKTGLQFTLIRPPLYLPIDHIIAPKTSKVHVEKLNRYGSDHNGLFARFEQWPQ